MSHKPLRVLVLGGDGVGPEVSTEALRIADWFIAHRSLDCEFFEEPFGLAAWREYQELLPPRTLQAVHSADAILFGAMGGDEYQAIPGEVRRAGGLLRLRRELGLYANVRPIRAWPALADICPLRPEVAHGTDLVIVRENTGGLYFGVPRGIETSPTGRIATNTQTYSTLEIERVARYAFELARTRRNAVCSVDKSNVLETGQLWRQTVQDLHDTQYPDVELSHMLVDNCAMQLVRKPNQFDVLVTDNMFGDILSDGGGAVSGSLGMLPSASLGAVDTTGRRKALYEPVHGSAPDIAGQGIANPIGMMLSLAMALRYSLERQADAHLLEQAVAQALNAGNRTADIAKAGSTPITTRDMGDAVLDALTSLNR